MSWLLQIDHADGRQSTLPLDRLPVTIGRGRSNDVVLGGWTIGSFHAELRIEGAGVHLRDRGSLAGTCVNGIRVDAFGPLTASDVIAIGGHRLRLLERMAVDAEVASPAPVVPEAAPPVSPVVVADARRAAIPGSPPPAPARIGVASGAPSTDRALASLRRAIHKRLIDVIDLRRTDVRRLSDEELRSEVTAAVRAIVAGLDAPPAGADIETLVTDVVDEAVGFGPLERLMADPDVSEIMVNSPDEIYVERAGRLQRSGLQFTSDEAVRAVIDRMVAPLGRRIDESSPMVDARLPDGSRVNAIIPPIALKGAALTIRRFGRRVFSPEELVRGGSASTPMMAFLHACVEGRRSVVVCGGTGSGKTSLLNVLSNFIPEHERLVTIEDAAELRLGHDHLIKLEARPANPEGRGAITIRDLVRNALRMRPDRIIVGECRGGETIDMLQAMNTGHEGSMTTVHANSPRDAIARLETMSLMAGLDLPLAAIREQIASAVDVLVQQTRFADGRRRITHVVEVAGVEAGRIQLNEIFRFRPDPGASQGGHFDSTGLLPEGWGIDAARIGIGDAETTR